MSNRLDKDREEKLQPVRRDYAIKQLHNSGINDIYRDETKIQFEFKGSKITLYFYSGWFTGKTVKDGRGIENLLKQLNKNTPNQVADGTKPHSHQAG